MGRFVGGDLGAVERLGRAGRQHGDAKKNKDSEEGRHVRKPQKCKRERFLGRKRTGRFHVLSI
jgi:hypothetical protein